MVSIKLLRTITTLAIILAWCVLMLGAYTRLMDAGLGCPDWPGCYGHLVVPSSKNVVYEAQHHYAQIPLEAGKAWTEMVHRYAAGTLVLLIVVLMIFSSLYRYAPKKEEKLKLPITVLFILLGLVLFQALLGMWTVTLKLLPVVVMGHLLGGMLIFSCLCYYRIQVSGFGLYWLDAQKKQNLPRQFVLWRMGAMLGFILVFLQIALGGWVSANYAGLACIGFPQCNGQWWPTFHGAEGFHFFTPVGANYQGGVLEHAVRASIQFVHRLGAVVVFGYLMLFILRLVSKAKDPMLRFSLFLSLFFLGLQLSLGVVNVTHLLPLWSAVLHNGVAALLLAALLLVYFFIRSEEHHDASS